MTTKEAQDTIRQMLKDWDNATDDQRAESLVIAAKLAKVAELGLCRNCGSRSHSFCNR